MDEIIKLLIEQIEQQKSLKENAETKYFMATEAHEAKKDIINNNEGRSNYYPEIDEFLKNIQLLKTQIDLIRDKKYEDIDIEVFKEIIKKTTPKSFKADDIVEKLKCCTEIKDDSNDPIISNIHNTLNQELIEALSNISVRSFQALPKLVNRYFDEYYKSDYEKSPSVIKEIDTKIEQLNKFLEYFNKGKGYFETREEFLGFYNGWFKSNVSMDKQIELLHELNKLNIHRKKLDKAKEEEIVEEINQNNEEVLKDLEEQSKPKEAKTIDDIDENDFDEEKRQTIIAFKELYKDLASKVSQRTMGVLELDSSEEDRELFYTNAGKNYSIDTILGDIDENIIPNLYTEQDKAYEIIKLIEKTYSKISKDIKLRETIVDKYDELIRNLSGHDNVHSKLNQNIRDGKLDYLLEDRSTPPMNGVHIEDVELSYYLRHTIDPVKELMSEEQEKVMKSNKEKTLIDLKEINILLSFIEEIEGIGSRNDFVTKLEEIYGTNLGIEHKEVEQKDTYFCVLEAKARNYYEAHGDEYIEKKLTRKKYPHQEHILLMYNDIDEESLKDKFARDEIRQTIISFQDKSVIKNYDTVRKYATSAKNSNKEEIPAIQDDFKHVKKIFSYSSGKRPGFSGRAIVVQFDVDNEIKKKLKETYDLGSQFTVCMLIDALSIANDNHDSYNDVKDLLQTPDVHDLIQSIADLLNNPSGDFEKVVRFIDAGLDRKDKNKQLLDSIKDDTKDNDPDFGGEGSSMSSSEGGKSR